MRTTGELCVADRGAPLGGAQVARSKSFMLVTSVSMSNQPVASSNSFTLKPKLGAQ